MLKVQAMMPTPKKVRKQIDEYNQEEGMLSVFHFCSQDVLIYRYF